VDAVATCDAEGREASVAIVNRDRDRARPSVLTLAGAAISGPVRTWEVNGPDVTATNSFEEPRRVDVRERTLEVRGARLELDVPAHSITLLRFGLGRP
jgi:alpha-L-arabinofuranosidase